MNAFRVSLCLLIGLLISWTSADGAERLPKRTKSAPVEETSRSVELFAGIDSRDLEVRYIPRDEKQGRIFITNRSGETLNVELPATFAATPILAEFFPQFPNNQQQSNQQQQNQSQNVGGSTSPWQSFSSNRRQSNNNANPFVFAIPSDQVAEIRVSSVCLEHGEPTPRAEIPYKLVPLATVVDDKAVEDVLTKLQGDDEEIQRQVQAAVWNLANDQSWDDLAAEKGKLIAAGKNKPYFSKSDLAEAKKLVDQANKKATEKLKAAETAGTAKKPKL